MEIETGVPLGAEAGLEAENVELQAWPTPMPDNLCILYIKYHTFCILYNR